MRSKNLDTILPFITIEVTEEAIVVDGARTVFINGSVSQNGLELVKRLEMVAKDLATAVKEAKGHLDQAEKAGTPVQSGNRRLEVKRGKRTSVAWKNVALDALKVDAKDEKAVRRATRGYTSTSRQTKVEIK